MRIESGYNNARLVSLDGRYAVEIELTQGKTTLIDLSDWEEARHLRWYTVRHKKKFYAQAAPAGCDYIYLHTFLIGRPLGAEVDHITGNSLDNRRSNLRYTSSQGQAQNRRKRKDGTSSRYKGVTWHVRKSRWYAAIKVDGRSRYLGYFSSEEDAAVKYDKAARELFGAFASTNFIYTYPTAIW